MTYTAGPNSSLSWVYRLPDASLTLKEAITNPPASIPPPDAEAIRSFPRLEAEKKWKEVSCPPPIVTYTNI